MQALKISKNKSPKIVDDSPNVYLRDFYLKDFKYMSPELVGVHRNKKNKMMDFRRKEETVTCKALMKIWLREVMKGLRQFLYGGSLHGVKYIFEPTFSRKERWTWIIIMFISIAICAINIIQLFCKWTSTPYVNVIDSLPTPIWAVPFPSVVFCPHLHVQLSYANVSELKDLEQFFASLICPYMSTKTVAIDHRMNTEENRMLQNFISQASPKCKDVVKSCNWKPSGDAKWVTEDCCDKLFKSVFTNYGLCFAFNGLPLNGMTNSTYNWQKTFNSHVTNQPLKWSLDTGYPKVFPPNLTTLPYRVMASGETNGLAVELYLNNSDRQLACDGNSLGFNIKCGRRAYSPPDGKWILSSINIRDKCQHQSRTTNVGTLRMRRCLPLQIKKWIGGKWGGIGWERALAYLTHYRNTAPMDHLYTTTVLRLPMDRMTTVEVSPITYGTDVSLRALVPEKRQCFFQNERKLKYYEFYTDSNCKHDLLIREAKRLCDCVLFNWPRKYIWEPICSTLSDLHCIEGVRAKVEEQLIFAYYSDSEVEQRPAKSASTSCYPSCNDIIYSSQVFYSDMVRDGVKPTWGDPASGEVTKVNVHLYDDIFLGQHRHAQYDDYYFVGAIGGLLSLFLGFSIISVAELVYFLILRPLNIVLRVAYCP